MRNRNPLADAFFTLGQLREDYCIPSSMQRITCGSISVKCPPTTIFPRSKTWDLLNLYSIQDTLCQVEKQFPKMNDRMDKFQF